MRILEEVWTYYGGLWGRIGKNNVNGFTTTQPPRLARRRNNPNYGHFRYPELSNKEWLYEKYWIENLAFSEIAEMIGCHLETVRRAVKRHNIPVKKDRFTKDANRLHKREDAKQFVSIKLKNEGVTV